MQVSSDEITYTTVGIPESKIFTMNKKVELQNKDLVTCTSNSIKSYDTLTQYVNQYFPSKHAELSYSNEFSSFSFWKVNNAIPETTETTNEPWRRPSVQLYKEQNIHIDDSKRFYIYIFNKIKK